VERPALRRDARVGLGRTTTKSSQSIPFQFHDPAIAAIAATATAVEAVMAMTPGSLRAEATRRGISVYQVRTERARAEGFSRAAGAGHGGGLRAAVEMSGWVTATNGQRSFVVAGGPAAVARLATRLHDERELASGRMSPTVFADRWRGRSVGGVRVSGRSAVVIASLHQAGAETEVRYLRGARR